jgi:hypothetical protein
VDRRTLAILTLFAAACSTDPRSRESSSEIKQPLALTKVQPLTTVHVEGAGEIEVENDYLPHVVCCENGAAPLEALKAQAVMARTYMLFRFYGEGVGTAAKPLTGTPADQAYFCQQKASSACKEAVASTRGQFTAYTNGKGERFANVSFFVDGPRPSCLAQKSCSCAKPSTTTSMTPSDHPDGCACFTFSSQGAANPAYVTYNWSHTGTTVAGSALGDPRNESNRGCASQNIQSCLGYAGWSYRDMLAMFYGQDIELVAIDGSEAQSIPPGTGTGPNRSTGDGEVTAGPSATPTPVDEASTDSSCSFARRGRSTNALPEGLGFAVLVGLTRVVRRARPRARSR